jgi:phosphonate transport system substrate-binding protein
MRASRLIAASIACLAAAVIAGCGSNDDTKTTSTKAATQSSAASSDAGCPNGRVRFGVEPYEDPAKLTPAYQVLAKALERQLGCPVKLQIVQDYSAEVLAMRNGQLDMAEFGPLGFVFAYQKANAQPLVSFANADGELSSYKAGIWVPKDSSIQNVGQLKGHSLALADPGSTSGDAMPRFALRQAGLSQSDVKLSYTGGHPESLLALVKGKVDAGELNTQELATAKAAHQFDPSKFRQIWSSDPIPNDPITIDAKLPAAFRAKVKQALTSLQPDDIAKVGSFLDVTPPGPMIEVSKHTYQPLFDLAQTLGLTEKDA